MRPKWPKMEPKPGAWTNRLETSPTLEELSHSPRGLCTSPDDLTLSKRVASVIKDDTDLQCHAAYSSTVTLYLSVTFCASNTDLIGFFLVSMLYRGGWRRASGGEGCQGSELGKKANFQDGRWGIVRFQLKSVVSKHAQQPAEKGRGSSSQGALPWNVRSS